MSRHRQVRGMDFGEDYEGYYDVYGHSVEDDYCVSPSTAAQFLYPRGDKSQQLAAFMAEEGGIKEEDEEEEDIKEPEEKSLSQVRSQLSETDQAKLLSCLEEMHNILGDSQPEHVLINAIISHQFNLDQALNTLLQSSSTSNVATALPQRQDRRQERGSQRKMPVVQKAPSDRLLPKPVVVVPPGDATARITNSVAMINFSGQRTEGFEMPKKETRSGSGSGSGSRPMSRERTPDRTPEKSPEKTLEVPPRKTRTLEQATDASSPAPASTPSLPKSASKAKGLDKLDMEMEYEKRKATKKQMLNLVVIGHVDAGKSTLMGHVLYKLGQVNQRTMHKYEQESRKQGKSSFAFAWVLDETPEERQRGVTMDVAQTQFETDTKSVTLLDAPGHKDFIPNMITGAASADVAVLVVCATRGEFETGFESGGQTREHALLVRSLGVSQLGVAVNKMDTVGWSQERFDEITRKLMQFLKQAGFKEKDVSFVPCSGLSGENLVAAATDPLLCSWYGGPSMLQVIDRFAAPQRPVDKPFRLVVSDVYKGMGSGFCVSGRIEAGSVQTGEKVLVMPTGDMALVKAIQLQDDLVTCAFAGDHVIVTLFNIEMTSAAIGHVLCYAAQPIRVASVIQARIVVFNIDMPITRGFPVVFHYQMLNETAVIRKLISQLHKSNGEVIKKRPRCLTKQSNALIELAIERPICMELYKDNRDLGRFMLRYSGHTIAAGLVTEIIS
ncbi:PREDICTED: HBS1-like protein isoform X4 [Priapulus caudatus]|uniref:HBS1-like protein isoform X4 n=1 Tax=Priapulus caudatus TaxID=37621 RepID=A0ABM1DRQ3_PRICU|nr:PREDICTED: HBS1-like protein isoform X4 [Priapulus caudatus]